MVELFSLFSVYCTPTLYMLNPERMQVKNRRKAAPLHCPDHFPGTRGEIASVLRTPQHLQFLPWTSCQQDFQGTPLMDWKEVHCSGDQRKLHGVCTAQENSEVSPIPPFQEAQIMRSPSRPEFP